MRRPELHDGSATLGRRRFLSLGAGLVATSALAACGTATDTRIGPVAPAVQAAERARRAGGARVVDALVDARPDTVDLGGVQAQTWLFGGRLPGPEIRVRRGDVLRARLRNDLPEPSTIHWHGIALRNDMDGVPDVTQPPVAAGSEFTYEFTAPDAGTYFFHPHVGMQLDRGLYAPLIVTDPDDAGDYDVEAVVVLDDWLDGVAGGDPDRQLEQLRAQGMPMDMGMGMGMDGMGGMGSVRAPLGGDTGDVDYPYYLINGRISAAPVTIQAAPGQRVRLRVINAASDTAFRVALAGHRLTVTHTDAFPVDPVEGDALLIGMGERYDVVVTAKDGVFPLVALPEGKQGQALAYLRTAGGAVPPAGVLPTELAGRLLTVTGLTAAEGFRLPSREPDRTHELTLGMDMSGYRWTINGKVFGENEPLPIQSGERARLRFLNRTMMFHPMHLHGHTFQIAAASGSGARKDTTIVLPMQTVDIDVQADNPGQWVVHCHNVYHMEAGMMTVLSYVE